jgi:succinate-semialdehyde dehydrogenase
LANIAGPPPQPAVLPHCVQIGNIPMRNETASINPATGQVIATYPVLDEAGLEAAIDRASAAWAEWRLLSVPHRAGLLDSLAQVLAAQRQGLARTITLEMGKPITAALAEVDKCANLCRWYARNMARLLADEVCDVGADGVATVSYRPLGLVLGVMPWNFPLWQVLRAAIPVVAAGNGFILKHAENVQGSALALQASFDAAGFPAGAFTAINIERDDIATVLRDARVCGVSVTAGVKAGAAVAAEAGRNLKKSLLELGGSDPFIVLHDADLSHAIPDAVTARFQNCGQVCIAAKRFIVDRRIAAEFIAGFVARTGALKIGDPLDPTTQMGPMARESLRSEVHGLVAASVAQGARLVLGGTIPPGPGAFYPPTVLVDVTNHTPVCRSETFGPVAPIMIADDAEHAIRLANDSDFGLSASIWSQSTGLQQELAQRIETGAVYVNGMSVSDPRVPIGGIKHSGYGRELGHFGLREFCNAQLRWLASANPTT